MSGEKGQRNKKSNHWYDWNGKKALLVDIAKELGLSYNSLYYRVHRAGWSLEKAVSTPYIPNGYSADNRPK